MHIHYWQHGPTGRVTISDVCPNKDWFEISKEFFDFYVSRDMYWKFPR